MRLDNLVSKALLISRNEAKSLIAKSRITVNQSIEKRKNRKIESDDLVAFGEQPLEFPADKYFMLNKPRGYVCSTVNDSMPSALTLLEQQPHSDLHFAGRLDADTTGLVLISNDGQWTHRISAPSRKKGKTYLASLFDEVSPEQVIQLEQGVLLNDSETKTLPAKVALLPSNHVRLTIYEGRYHQVKRMFAAVGNHVISLHRESIGDLALDTNLPEGGWRALTRQEVGLF